MGALTGLPRCRVLLVCDPEREPGAHARKREVPPPAGHIRDSDRSQRGACGARGNRRSVTVLPLPSSLGLMTLGEGSRGMSQKYFFRRQIHFSGIKR